MALKDVYVIEDLMQAEEEIKSLEVEVIERARLWLELNGKATHSFINENGFSVRVWRESLLSPKHVNVIFYQQDVQGKGSAFEIIVPRDFILGDSTAEEKEFKEYQRLKAKFEK